MPSIKECRTSRSPSAQNPSTALSFLSIPAHSACRTAAYASREIPSFPVKNGKPDFFLFQTRPWIPLPAAQKFPLPESRSAAVSIQTAPKIPDIGASMQSPSHSRDLFSPASAGSSSFSHLSGWQPHRPPQASNKSSCLRRVVPCREAILSPVRLTFPVFLFSEKASTHTDCPALRCKNTDTLPVYSSCSTSRKSPSISIENVFFS